MSKTRRALATASLAAASCLCNAPAEHQIVPLELFSAHGDLEVTVWAESPMLLNPTNMDTDAAGRIWVAEGVNYRRHGNRHPEGDRIRVLQDTDGDGRADGAHTFVQEPFLTAPLGVAVLDNKIYVSMTPTLVIYTDVDRDLKFDPEIDTREEFLTGFNAKAKQHDHSLHSITAGPDGKLYFNHGNCGAEWTDKSGKTFRVGSAYMLQNLAGKKSDDGHVWLGGVAYRMNPDGTNAEPIGHNFRNSYEQTVTSFGDVFQNDNDDPPACRTSFLLEYGNAGFCSEDGKRNWRTDMRPGQTTQIAEWRQEDPGTMPAGDVYGGGSPTGICFYEGGALGQAYAGGLLLSCEPARNTVFGYLPVPEGAGWKLERFDFLTTNKEQEFAGADFKGGRPNNETKTLFRPSDVMVGVDGAIYVADWYDPRVGGHQDLDNTLSGAIYRIAPKGFKPEVPTFDLATTKGQIAALKSHAVNVRNLGFTAIKAQGEKALAAVTSLLNSGNPFHAARAIYLLPHLGTTGTLEAIQLLSSDDARQRLTAFRALRRADVSIEPSVGVSLAKDPDPQVRRELATSLRDTPADKAVPLLVEVAKRFDGEDRTYLDALGIGATGKEEATYAAIAEAIGDDDAGKWSPAFAKIAWRLHPDSAAADLKERATAGGLNDADRRAAVVALAFVNSKAGSAAMLDLAASATGTAKADALWWLLSNKNHRWAEHGIDGELKSRGIYDPGEVELVAAVLPPPVERTYAPAAEILAMDADVARGKAVAGRCYMCHHIDGAGIDYGPALTDYGKTQTREVILNAIINPGSDIAHGFGGHTIVTKDDIKIQGRLLSTGDPLIIQSTGGITQMVPKDRVKKQWKLKGNESLMMSAAQQALTEQDLADLVAYLKSL